VAKTLPRTTSSEGNLDILRAGFFGCPNGFTYGYPVIDGVMNWDGAWPYESDGKVDVSSMSDKAYFIDTHTYAKTFMMGTLPLFAIISAERLGVESSAPSLREVHR
jgi:hypothetical protein